MSKFFEVSFFADPVYQVEAENEEEAFEKAEERSIDDAFDEDILDMELLDVCDENYEDEVWQ